MLSVKEMVRMTLRGPGEWGTQGYRVPVDDPFYKTTQTLRWVKPKSTGDTYIDRAVKQSKSVPDPTRYSKIRDWKMDSRGFFSKTKKQTMFDSILKGPKQPGPGSY